MQWQHTRTDLDVVATEHTEDKPGCSTWQTHGRNPGGIVQYSGNQHKDLVPKSTECYRDVNLILCDPKTHLCVVAAVVVSVEAAVEVAALVVGLLKRPLGQRALDVVVVAVGPGGGVIQILALVVHVLVLEVALVGPRPCAVG